MSPSHNKMRHLTGGIATSSFLRDMKESLVLFGETQEECQEHSKKKNDYRKSYPAEST